MRTFLYQSSRGYCYNSDSIFLYAFAREFKIKGNVLDIGCGVGVLASLLAKDFKADFYAVEKQEEMAFYAKKNFKLNSLDIKLINSDFLKFTIDTQFDYIISNPPFYKVDKHQSPNISKNIARYEHHLPLDRLINKVSKLLKPKGYFIFCYDAWQLEDILVELNNNNIRAEFIKFVHSKGNKEAKIVMITARKGSNARSKILPPLIVFDKSGKYTDEAKEAFELADTHSIKADIEEN